MTSEEMAEDPHPALPAAFADEVHVAQLAEMQRPDEVAEKPEIPTFSGDSELAGLAGKDGSHRPRVLVRTVLSSMASSVNPRRMFSNPLIF